MCYVIQRHGKGVLSSPDETFKYAGEWVNDYRHGKGIFTDNLGTYEGEWVEDKVSFLHISIMITF